MRLPLLRVAVSGPSMVPTLGDGEWWIAQRRSGMAAGIAAGDLVVIEGLGDAPGLAVKRAIRREAVGWWVEGDNSAVSRDSRHFGAVPDEAIVGRLLVRYRPLPLRRARHLGG